tara:strand:- start:15 stop:386 length:372 start_codon:yes stop_codon:yes gene_type:complete
MPQGKGTYGSEVGRPPKKLKKYQVGGEVEAILEAALMGEDFPMTNAMERSQTYQLGGPVRPPTAPSMPQYKKGGKVEKTKKKVFTGEKDITDVVKAVDKKLKKEKAEWKEHTIFGPQFKKGVS